jgi:septum formation protein
MNPSSIYLASKSPRRQALLSQLGVRFDVLLLREDGARARDVEERAEDGEPPLHYVERIARTKAQVGFSRMQSRRLAPRPVLGADTEVIVDGTVLGKPANDKDAARMLAMLSGRTHQVATAVALRWEDRTDVEMSVSDVGFRKLTAAEIRRYVATGEPNDKAGAYAIQGVAAAFITRLSGSYSGVMGLPLAETATLLARVGIRVL